MTGFGSAQGQAGGYRWTIDVRSVNARGLDIRTRIPDGIEGFEKRIRDRVGELAARGSVNVNLRLGKDDVEGELRIEASRVEAALAAIAAVESASKDKGMALAPSRATDILAMRGVMDVHRDGGPDKATVEDLWSAMQMVFTAWAVMRQSEGQAIAQLLNSQIGQIAELTDAAEAAAGQRIERMRSAIAAALNTITSATEIVEPGKVEAELALIAVKADVTEEIDRLRTHVKAAKALLGSDGPIGRKLDFLTQEFNREANTLCSKAQSAELTSIGLDLKSVIDQMREQVQNVE